MIFRKRRGKQGEKSFVSLEITNSCDHHILVLNQLTVNYGDSRVIHRFTLDAQSSRKIDIPELSEIYVWYKDSILRHVHIPKDHPNGMKLRIGHEGASAE
ncbi:MAG: hypothetical protein K9K78_01865 [Spirochaetales bacterium]|nr:hypothetical protein [Spirochaetales bacterium]